jgi:predicted anti-sigma-YlaC factor YlaD
MPNSLKEKLRDSILDLMKSRCTDTSKHISENMDGSISASKWLKIGFHLAICEHCREYKTQLKTLRHLTQSLEKEAPDMETQGRMKTDSKERMKQLLKSK